MTYKESGEELTIGDFQFCNKGESHHGRIKKRT